MVTMGAQMLDPANLKDGCRVRRRRSAGGPLHTFLRKRAP